MAKSQNPMDAFRREQKKKDLKKHQKERQKEKQTKLAELDVDEIRDRLKKLERQVHQNPVDGPTRKRKQELEDTLNAALKKQRAVEEEQQAKQEETTTSANTMTLSDLNAANRERYQNPENSVYYHPVLNPFGAPPPGRPQMYRVPPPAPVRHQATGATSSSTTTRAAQHGNNPSRGSRSSGGGAPRYQQRPAPVHGPVKHQRPGKRPPLPSGPPPPGTIQIPRRPPLPSSGNQAQHPPPPPPSSSSTHGLVPPPPPPALDPPAPSPSLDVDMNPRAREEEEERCSAVAVASAYPPHQLADADTHATLHNATTAVEDDDDDVERLEKQMRLRSLVPTTLRVQRRPPPPRFLATHSLVASSVPRPPAPLSTVPGPPLVPVVAAPLLPIPTATVLSTTRSSSSVSTEFDAFMEEMKTLGAI